jgi:hypothetical protein
MPCIGQMERFQPFPFAGAATRTPDDGAKAFHDGRLSDFRTAQAATSLPAPWDPRPKIRGDVDRRRTDAMARKSDKMRRAKT